MPTAATQLRGLALPALRSPHGYAASKGPYDVAWGDMLLALFTPIGTRPMLRSFGSALHKVLFEPISPLTIQRIRYIVSETLTQWVPHVTLIAVSAVIEKAKIRLQITFRLATDARKDVRTVDISRSGDVRAASGLRLV